MYNEHNTHTHSKDVNFVIGLPTEIREFVNDVFPKGDQN